MIQIRLLLILVLMLSDLAVAQNLLGLPPLKIPQDNPQTHAKIALGRLLFHDKRFSADGTISCAHCHHADKAFSDGKVVAEGIRRMQGPRNTPTIVNAAFYNSLFLDGRAKSLEAQSLGPFVNLIEHGLQDHQPIIEVIRNDSQYTKYFSEVFNIQADAINMQYVAKAIASFERTLIAGNSLFDQYYFGKQKDKLSASAARGSRIFRRKGNCANCHEISWDNALFTDNRFYNIGVGAEYLQGVLDQFLAQVQAGTDPAKISITDKQRSELGRFNVTHNIKDIGKFKTPTLRNINLTAPYMHDGSMATLFDVIEYYDKGGNRNRFLDNAIFPLKLSKQEKQDLLAFLHSLTSAQYRKK